MKRSSLLRRMTGVVVLLLVVLPASFAVACGDEDDVAQPPRDPGEVELEGELLVFAASSLTDVFTELGEVFSEAHPDLSITFNFQASSALATQISEGAPADVFASANRPQMEEIVEAGDASDTRTFATNEPVIVVPSGTDAVTTIADLANDGVRLVLAGEDVPIGLYAREVLANASTSAGFGEDFAEMVLANVQSNEANVRAVLTKVQLGEADAGIVYRTDAVLATGEVDIIEIPDEYNVSATYPIAVVDQGDNPEAASAWIEFVLSDDGQVILRSFGFGPAE